MKKYITALSMGIILVIGSSCRTTHVHKAPPGQVKKVAGTKSANPYAPGQMKKATGTQSAKPFAPGQQKQAGKSKKKKIK